MIGQPKTCPTHHPNLSVTPWCRKGFHKECQNSASNSLPWRNNRTYTNLVNLASFHKLHRRWTTICPHWDTYGPKNSWKYSTDLLHMLSLSSRRPQKLRTWCPCKFHLREDTFICSLQNALRVHTFKRKSGDSSGKCIICGRETHQGRVSDSASLLVCLSHTVWTQLFSCGCGPWITRSRYGPKCHDGCCLGSREISWHLSPSLSPTTIELGDFLLSALIPCLSLRSSGGPIYSGSC